jgi:predicted dehydrogenase
MIGRVEAVLVATPNSTHADIACPLLEAGIHVLCEKPMATTSAGVERMFQASARGGGRLMAAHSRRFNANVVMLESVLSRGWLGGVKEISGALGGSYDTADRRTEFRREPRLSGGGVLIDLGIHLIDLAVCLAGQSPVSVGYDAECAPGWSAETDADVALEFPDGSCANFSVSFTRELDATLTVRGTQGWASASLNAPGHLMIFSQRARVCQRAGVQNLVLDDRPSYERQIEHFTSAVLANGDFIIRADEVRAGLAIIEQCYGRRRREDALDRWQSRPESSSVV